MVLEDITAAILAGGLGTRLRSIIKGKQKVLATVKNYPFLKYLLDRLDKSGIKKIVICTGYLGEQVKKEFGNTYGNLSIFYSQENSKLDTAGAIRLALPLFKSKTILVLNGDSFCNTDIKGFLDFHLHKKANASLVLSKINDISSYGQVTLDENDQITHFKEKSEGNHQAGLINAGMYLINRQLISDLPDGVLSLEKEIFPKWIGQKFYGYKTSNGFIDIGTKEGYKQAENFFTQFNI